jgi:CubicO group peptidase (beta-lactamase class C family)
MFWWTAIAAAHASLAAAQIPIPTDDCPILGPAFPSDFNVSSSTAIREAISAFPGLVDNLFNSGVMNRSDVSFAIDVFSSETNASIYNYAHSGEDLKSSLTAGVLDDGTIFRIGSVSKIHTVYAILAVAGMEIFEHPVTKYLPELARDDVPGDRIVWNEVTVGALASQMGGTGGFRELWPIFPVGELILTFFQSFHLFSAM